LSKNKEIGQKGESIAVDYLTDTGYNILCTNYRYDRFEIDIIAEKENTLIFVEVKTRKSFQYGLPEEAVDEKKINNILTCADHYLNEIQWTDRIRFDILSISLFPEPSIKHIEDAFF
jgi:putative endonuclease